METTFTLEDYNDFCEAIDMFYKEEDIKVQVVTKDNPNNLFIFRDKKGAKIVIKFKLLNKQVIEINIF